jgi:MoCo/4Fe-4S cofactor protein with predicted Tat translocation signal
MIDRPEMTEGDLFQIRPLAEPAPILLRPRVDLAAIREKLEQATGPEYWRSLEEVAETEEFRRFVEDEFPNRTPDWNNPGSRRTFLKLMGASLALAGVSACTKQPPEAIVPYVRQPEEFIPGKPLFYATAMPFPGGAAPVLVESHLGRPTKIEGNPTHPASLGATDAYTLASILDMYDPDRLQTVLKNGAISSWLNFVSALNSARDETGAAKGEGFRILSGSITSPTLGAQFKQFLAAYPAAQWHVWEPAAPAMPYNPVYNLANADVIVALDSDFLNCGGSGLRYARDFADRRRVMSAEPPAGQKSNVGNGPKENQPEGTPEQGTTAMVSMNRLYVFEGTPSITGSAADHRFRVKSSEVGAVAAALASAVGAGSGASAGSAPQSVSGAIAAVAKDLQAHRGRCVVIPGLWQPPAVHAAAHAINQALGAVGSTVSYAPPIEANPVNPVDSLRALVADINAGRVQSLVMIGVNPVYDAPADLGFSDALKKVKLRALLTTHANETSRICHWVIPMAHYLESWSDARSFDGTAVLIQPLIAPLYNGRTAHELLSVLNGQADADPRTIVQDHWRPLAGGDFDTWWQRTLNDGVVSNSAPPGGAAPDFGLVQTKAPASGGMEIVFRPDAGVYDGRFSNNGWLQEMPKPLTRVTWDNAAWVSPATAQKLSVQDGDLLEISYRGRKVTAPAWVLPGHADDSVTVQLGYGRTNSGRVGNGVGFDAYAIRHSDALWFDGGAEIRKVPGSYEFASQQHTQTMEERHPVWIKTLAEYQTNPEVPQEKVPPNLSMFPNYKYEGYKWGMSIDLTSCIGCQACTVACQAENNIPVVGKDQVSRGRHMNWLRVDRYYRGKLDDPETYFQPVACMHCEQAPCELVCPVGATVHSGEGLNQMIYNRCVGTRYCSNNCPYKVRRFNFYLYSDWYTESLYGLRNPDVTVRSRGVMEKCTYCVQRINAAKIASEKEDRRIRDGEILTACQQACPTQAIVFGDINDPNSRVAKLKAQPSNYSLLEEQNTRPRTTYLARLRNPNPEFERASTK